MFSIAALPLYHAESVPAHADDAQALHERMQELQRHRVLHGDSLVAAMRRRGQGQPAEDVFFDRHAGRDLLVGVLPHPFCNRAVTGCGFCTFPHERYHAGEAGKVVERIAQETDGRLNRQPALARRRAVALYLGLELLVMAARLGCAIFLTMGFAAGLGVSGGTTLANPIAVRLCVGFFLWSLALISYVTSRRT
jgi:hypothetical protein